MADSALRELRRGQIVTAARALVAKGGLEALTIGALEARLSFTRGVITHHFSGKDEIVEAVLDSAIAEIDVSTKAEIEAGATVEEIFHAILAGTTRGFLERREAGRILLSFWGRIPSDKRATKINAKLYATYRAQVVKRIARGVEAGRIDAAVDAEAIAALMVGIVIGIATQVYFEPGAIDPEPALKIASEALARRVRG